MQGVVLLDTSQVCAQCVKEQGGTLVLGTSLNKGKSCHRTSKGCWAEPRKDSISRSLTLLVAPIVAG